jgi:hypothetical protein
MYRHRLVDMRRHKVVIAGDRTGHSSSGCNGWLLQKTLHRSDVPQSFCLLKGSPDQVVSSNISGLRPLKAVHHSFLMMELRQPTGFAATSKQANCKSNSTVRSSRILTAAMTMT